MDQNQGRFRRIIHRIDRIIQDERMDVQLSKFVEFKGHIYYLNVFWVDICSFEYLVFSCLHLFEKVVNLYF